MNIKRFFVFIACCSLLFGEEDDFDMLMGKNTKHWENVQNPEEIALLQKFRDLYNEKKHLMHATAAETKIPKVVHFIWLGPRAFPPESVENVRNWIAKNPGWKFKFWTDRPRPAPCNGMETIVMAEYPFPYLGQYYAVSENWGEKSDLLRYEILFAEGGVYVDHDANCLLPFEGLHAGYDFYCCLEAPHPPVAGLNITSGMGVVGSRSGHPVIKRVIDLIGAHWNALAEKYPGKDGFSRTQIVMERTYLPLTHVIKEGIGENGNVDIVLPAAYFFAKSGIKSLYSKHFYGNSWAHVEGKNPPFERETKRELNKIDQKIDNATLFSVVVLSFNLILIVSLILLFRKQRKFHI
jgi:mannosyltransferase OCH1-like enzyme